VVPLASERPNLRTFEPHRLFYAAQLDAALWLQ